jgi:hypothetical protein
MHTHADTIRALTTTSAHADDATAATVEDLPTPATTTDPVVGPLDTWWG